MKHILFVDDDESVLAGLKRMLRGMRHEWDMTFVGTGEAALEALAGRSYDVLVSDMRMPGMDGIALFKAVLERHPAVVRIALSGHAELAAILESVRLAHQYLAKPCPASTLKLAVERACGLRDLLHNPAFERLLGQLSSLPTPSALYGEVMEEIARPNGSLARVGEIIGRDGAMSAKMLQLVNSAFFGLPRHVASPAQACTVLGTEVVRTLLLSVKIFSELDREGIPLDLARLWRHGSDAGALAKRIAAASGEDRRVQDLSLMAGMLHEIGKLVLASQLPQRYRLVVVLEARGLLDDVAAEHAIFGCTHMEIGAYLLGLWGLPNALVEAIAYHHQPSHAVGEAFAPLTALHVADRLYEDGDAARLDRAYLRRLGLEERIAEWLELYQQARGEVADAHEY